jgi:sugar lactone lactonase YvrE
MRQLPVVVLILTLIITACQSPKSSTEETVAKDTIASTPVPMTLTLKWETDTVLTTCESVLYDSARDVLYVSNINGAPDGKDGNGFISKVGLDGKVQQLQWIKGLNAPKGLGIYQDKLYVADIDRVLEIDINKSKIVKTYAVEGAKFLNDVTVDATGRVYVSDTGAGNIVVIENGKLSKWLDVDGPNGLLAEDGKLQLLGWNAKTLSTIDVASKQVTVNADSIENPDGIEPMGDGSYIISSWNGMIHYVDPSWKSTTVLDLRADSVSSADIEYIQDKKLLFVPTFFKNTVRAYEVSMH